MDSVFLLDLISVVNPNFPASYVVFDSVCGWTVFQHVTSGGNNFRVATLAWNTASSSGSNLRCVKGTCFVISQQIKATIRGFWGVRFIWYGDVDTKSKFCYNNVRHSRGSEVKPEEKSYGYFRRGTPHREQSCLERPGTSFSSRKGTDWNEVPPSRLNSWWLGGRWLMSSLSDGWCYNNQPTPTTLKRIREQTLREYRKREREPAALYVQHKETLSSLLWYAINYDLLRNWQVHVQRHTCDVRSVTFCFNSLFNDFLSSA
jgi:hypothetical protein